ncbi:hypothetical protein TNCV_1466461 [Trichonephila clavipes]|nr:hypothetical protein TNCV_1466461 [Trichonephila clavipes]
MALSSSSASVNLFRVASKLESAALRKIRKFASSGIAANLLNGGQTAHSEFQLRLDIHEKTDAMCNIKKCGMATSRFISGLRNDIRRFVLARDPNNLEESINAALIEEQNVKLNQIANDERTGLSPLYTETSVISALTSMLDEINLRVKRLQEASSVTARKTGGGLFRRRETVFKCFYCGLEGHRQTECRRKRAEECQSNSQRPWGKAASEFSVFRHPNTHSFDQQRLHLHDSAFCDNNTAPRHSATVPQRTSRDRGNAADFRRNMRNDTLNFRGESRI